MLEVFDASLPRYRLKHRLKVYKEFLTYAEWERQLKTAASPIILLVCPATADLIYAKRRMKKLLEYEVSLESISIKITTREALEQYGVTSNIWEDV